MCLCLNVALQVLNNFFLTLTTRTHTHSPISVVVWDLV